MAQAKRKCKKWKKPVLTIFASLPMSERSLLAACVSGGNPSSSLSACSVYTPSPGCNSCSS